MNPEHIILHLSLLKGIGPAIINRIVETIPAEQLSELYLYLASDFVVKFGLNIQSAQDIVSGLSDMSILKKELALIEKHSVQVMTIINSCYPSLLRAIYLPPSVLYSKGSLIDKEEQVIAFVGARAATEYGKRVIDAYIPPLVQHGWHIVSGGARGIDAFAHQAAVRANGKTTVVLGSGLLQLYPTQNVRLFSAIIDQGGALLSSFPMRTEPLPGNFPARNRIIAGLSKACVVVQAVEKSGALITASFALDQGKEIFAVPGSFDDPLSAGCHALLKQGAQVATSADDILLTFGQSMVNDHQQEFEQNSIPTTTCATLLPENPLVALCKQPIAIDELVQQTGLSLLDLQTTLFDLQLEGKLSQNFMGLWHST